MYKISGTQTSKQLFCYRHYADCLVASLHELERIFNVTPHSIASVDTHLLIDILDLAATSPEVQITAFRMFTQLRFTIDPSLFVRLLSEHTLAYAIRILKINTNQPEVQIVVCEFLSTLSEDSRIAHRVVASGLIQVLGDTLNAHLSNNDCQSQFRIMSVICHTLFRLSVVEGAPSIAVEAKILPVLVKCLGLDSMDLKK